MMSQIQSYTRVGHTEVQIKPHGQLYITLECFHIVTTAKRIVGRADQDTGDLLLFLLTIENLLLEVRENSDRGGVDQSGYMSQYNFGLRRMLDIANIVVIVRLCKPELDSVNANRDIPWISRLHRRVQSNARPAERAVPRYQVRKLTLQPSSRAWASSYRWRSVSEGSPSRVGCFESRRSDIGYAGLGGELYRSVSTGSYELCGSIRQICLP